jgi:16S rRNA (uracil1498-N3)-methyltransferase
VPPIGADSQSLVASENESIELNSDLSHHLREVLRLDEGKQLSVVCRQTGLEYLGIISSAARGSPLSIKIIRSIERSLPIPLIKTLACGLPKGSHPDQICEQVSQLGIEQIVFWLADRSVAQPKQASSKLERWQKIAETSARQSKQNSIPKVSYLTSSSEFYTWLRASSEPTKDLIAICSLAAKAEPIASIESPQGRVHLIVGPEGDFSAEELATFEELGSLHVSLGPLVLRVETAALVAVSMGLAVWGWR